MGNELKRGKKNRNIFERIVWQKKNENPAFTWRRMETSEFLIPMVEFSPSFSVTGQFTVMLPGKYSENS